MNQVCYDSLNRQAEALLDGESNMIAAMANFSALINQALPELNWVGFYIKEGEQLGKVRTSPRTALAYEQKRVRGIQIKEGWLPFKAEYQRDRDCSKAP